jgi:hypothetical protein
LALLEILKYSLEIFKQDDKFTENEQEGPLPKTMEHREPKVKKFKIN